MGTKDAVTDSAIAAPALTVAMARTIATVVMPMGTTSDDDDDADVVLAASTTASLVAKSAVTVALPRDVGAPRIMKPSFFGTTPRAMRDAANRMLIIDCS